MKGAATIKRKYFKYFIIGTILLFAITLYWVELSPWSSTELAKFNNGYGTFDMKSYDVHTVYKVLNQMKPEGFTIYERYFIGDYLFILALGILQVLILLNVFSWSKSRLLRLFIISIPAARGLCDIMENSLLLNVLLAYPQKHEHMVTISSKVTFIKLHLITLWLLLFLFGVIIKRINPIKNLKMNIKK